MPSRQRIAVNFLFSLGFIVTIAGIVRTWFIYKSLILEYDQTWYAYPLWIAAAVEIDLGVICASAPVLRPLLARLPFSLSIVTSALKSKSHSGGDTPEKSNSKSRSSAQATVGSKTSRSILPESACDITVQEAGPQYELGIWVDVERANRSRTHSHGSQDTILPKEEGILDGTTDICERNGIHHEA